MGAAGYQLNKKINNTVAYKKAQRPSPSTIQNRNVTPIKEEVVDLNASPFASTIGSPSIGLQEPIKVMGSRTEPDPDFNVADWYERTQAKAEEAITPEAVRKVLTRHDPGRGELYGTSPSGYLMDQQVGDPFIETIRSKQIPLAKELDTPFELDYDYDYHSDKLYMKQPPLLGNTDLQQGFTDKEREEYRDLMKRGRFVDISGGTSRVGEYTMAWVEDPPEPSGFSKFLNNPVVNVLGAINPVIGLATTTAKVATGEKLSPVEIVNGLMTGLNMTGVVKPPVPNVAGDKGTGLFGTTYGQTQTALNVAAAGDAKGAALALVGDDLIKSGLDKVGLDQSTIERAGIQYDDFEAGVNKTVQKLAEGEELDEALAFGVGKYIGEGGTLGSIDLPSINLPSINLGDSEILEPIADALSAAETAVRQGLSKFDKEVLQPITKPIGDTLSAAETEVRQGLSTLDKEVLQPITQPIGDIVEDVAQESGDIIEDVAQGAGDVLSDLDTAVRQALPDIDLPSVDLPSIDLPFDLRPSLMSDTGEDFIPSPTRTTDSLFNDELFQFKTEIGISDYPIEVQEELELFYPESALQLDYGRDPDNFFENTIYEAKPRSYIF